MIQDFPPISTMVSICSYILITTIWQFLECGGTLTDPSGIISTNNASIYEEGGELEVFMCKGRHFFID